MTPVREHHIHGFLGYFTVAATIFTIGSTIALVLGQYERASRSLSTRQGVQRRRLVQLFLGLALACFVVITTLKYANPVARREVADTLSGAPSREFNGQPEASDVDTEQVEVPGRYVVTQLRWC